MGRKSKNSSLEQRKLVLQLHLEGKTYKETADLLEMKPNTVGDIVRRFKNEGRVEYIKQKGQPKKLTDREEAEIVRKVKKNPRLSAPELKAELFADHGKTVSAQTVRRTIKKQGYNGRVARKKPLLSERNRKLRENFAKEYAKKDQSWWDDVIFLDESKFNLFGSDGKTMVWRKPNTELQKQHLRPTVKHGGGSVMIWGCISSKGVGNLVFIDGIMNQDKYLKILEENLKQSAEKMGIRNTFKLYQDNDPKHKAYKVRSWLLYNCPKVLETPPQSPDLNPIENLWSELDRRVHKTPISSISALKERLQEEWAKIGPEYTQKIIANMPKRLNDTLRNNGYHTKY